MVMEPTIEKRLGDLEKKIDEIYVSVEKTRKYFFWTLMVTLAVFILPLVGLMFAIPSFLNNYTETINTLGI